MKGQFIFFVILFITWIAQLNAEEMLEETRYQRKSLASLGQVVVLSDRDNLVDPVGLKNVWDSYIKMARFDQNVLPESMSDLFLNIINSQEVLTIESLGNIVKDVYAGEIQKVLLDPKIQQARIEQFKQTDTYSFEFGKGKSYSVTAKDLENLFSSAFFYIPFVSDVTYKKEFYKKKIDGKYYKKKRLKVMMDAGIIWYQIKILPNNDIAIEHLKTITASKRYDEEEEPAVEDAYILEALLSKCAKNIGREFSYKTKGLSAFNLKGRIESINKQSIELMLGKREGVSLDDYFFIMEDYQSDDGVNSRSVGLAYINKFYQAENRSLMSQATQIYGKNSHLGTWVKESPRYGVSLQLNLGKFRGFSVDSRDAQVGSSSFFTNSVNDAMGLDAVASYLVSHSNSQFPYSQLYVDINFNYLPTSLDYGNLINNDYSYFSSLVGVSAGVRKHFWIKKIALQPFFYIGANQFSISESFRLFFGDDEKKPVFELTQTHLKFGVSVEKMVHPYVLINFSMFQTLGLGSPNKTYISYYKTFFESEVEEKAKYSYLGWTGFSFGVRFFR